jgi:hypothetical protein
VKIFNSDGMAIFGPGSEWLWNMAQFAALAVTGFAIYRQLRAQGSANALTAQSSLGSQWDSEPMLRFRLAALMHIAAGKSGWPPTLNGVGDLLEGIAVLQSHGHLQLADTWEEWSYPLQIWWALAGPLVLQHRATYPNAFTGWEKLAARMAALDRQAGGPMDLSLESLATITQNSITGLIERLRLEQEIKTGVIPTWPPEVAVPAASGT